MANFQVTIKQTVLGRDMMNVTNWQLASNTAQYLQDFTDALRASFFNNVLNQVANDWTFRSLVFRQMDGGAPFTVEVTPTLGDLIGLDGNEVLPTTVCMLVSTIYVGGRPNRGRCYFAGLTEQAQANGTFDSAARTAWQNLVTGWATGMPVTGGTAFLRIARPNFTTNTWTLDNPVNTVIARTNPATQRKRRLGTS